MPSLYWPGLPCVLSLYKYIICLLSSFHALISTSSGSPRRQYIGTWYKKKLTNSEFYPTAVFFVTTIGILTPAKRSFVVGRKRNIGLAGEIADRYISFWYSNVILGSHHSCSTSSRHKTITSGRILVFRVSKRPS